MSEQNDEQTWKLVESEPIKKSTPNLAKALAQFQATFSNAVKDANGNFGSYVSLSEAEFAVSPATEFGISHTFITECGTGANDQPLMYITCRLMHESGEFIDSRLPLITENQRGQNTQSKQQRRMKTHRMKRRNQTGQYRNDQERAML